jgi:outer membrane protein assembly factor BamB
MALLLRSPSMSRLKLVFKLLLPISLLSLTLSALAAQDWPQWRGPNRDGVVPPSAEPQVWPDELKQKWQVHVGIGYSSPVSVDNRVYAFARQGEKEVVLCLEFANGKEVWRDAYEAPYTMHPAAAAHEKGPKSTPALFSGRLVTLGISGIMSCHNAQNGRLLWRREFSSDFKATSPYFGTATSPLIEGRLVIAHVGGHDSGALMAFDIETGKTVWSWSGDGPAYTSPIAVNIGGTRQIVSQSQENIIGVSASDGRLLWKIPFATPHVQNIITPIFFGNLLIFSGLDQGVMAIKVAKGDKGWKPEKVWQNSEASFYMSTPVLNGNLLFGMSHKNKGQFVALDAANGETAWETQGREGDNAAILTVGDKLLLLGSDGELIVARANRSGFEPFRRYNVAKSATWAHPLLSGNSILIKDFENLTLWSLE